MRLAFMGTPDFAVPTLDALLAAGHELAAVYTQPPRPAGRGKALAPSPVQRRAEAAGIEVRTPATLRDPEAQAAFAALDLDAAVVAAYGLILPAPILEAPRRGCLNVHASLLPRWRGAAPIQRAILAGDEMTGVTIMQMERGLDTGPVYARSEMKVNYKNAGELAHELAAMGARLMVDVLDRLTDIKPVPQREDGVTYAAKVSKEEARLDFKRPAREAERQVRAFNPAPGAFFELNGERVKVLSASFMGCNIGLDMELSRSPAWTIDGASVTESGAIRCAGGFLVPQIVQRGGKSPMPWNEFLRGFRHKATNPE